MSKSTQNYHGEARRQDVGCTVGGENNCQDLLVKRKKKVHEAMNEELQNKDEGRAVGVKVIPERFQNDSISK